jgi:hypothetical protein
VTAEGPFVHAAYRAGLLFHSYVAILQVDPGFHQQGVLTMSTALSVPKLVGARRYVAFYESFVENLAQLRGVTVAGANLNMHDTLRVCYG